MRPPGYLETRYLDAQPPGSWLHPVALLAALLDKPSTVDKVLDTCASCRGLGRSRTPFAADGFATGAYVVRRRARGKKERPRQGGEGGPTSTALPTPTTTASMQLVAGPLRVVVNTTPLCATADAAVREGRCGHGISSCCCACSAL